MTEVLPEFDVPNHWWLIAYLDVAGSRTEYTAKKVGLAVDTIYNIRSKPNYRELKNYIRAKVHDRVVQKLGDLAGRYDAAAGEAFETAYDIMQRGTKEDKVRLDAAEFISDRAPNAPKKIIRRQDEREDTLKVLIGVSYVDNMKKALIDTGHSEVIDLIERAPSEFETDSGSQTAGVEADVDPRAHIAPAKQEESEFIEVEEL